jgi:hypothetical protein
MKEKKESIRNFDEDFINDQLSDDFHQYLLHKKYKYHNLCSDDLTFMRLAVKNIEDIFDEIEHVQENHTRHNSNSESYYWTLKIRKEVLEYCLKNTNKQIREELTERRTYWRERK